MILPGDAEDPSEAAQVKCVVPAFLPGVESPARTTVQQCAQHTRLIHLGLDLDGEHGVLPHSLAQAGHCCLSPADPHVQLGVQAEVAWEVGPKIDDVLHHVEGAVAYGDAGSSANVLAQDVSLFDTDREAKLWTGMGKAVNELLEGSLGVSCDGGVNQEEHLPDEDFAHLSLGSDACQVEQATIASGV